VKGLRRRLRPYRIHFAVLAGVLTTVLSTVYESVPPALRIVALAAVAVMSGIALLLTDTGALTGRGSRDGARDWPTGGRPVKRRRWRRVDPIAPAALFTGRGAVLRALLDWHARERERRNAEHGRALGCVTLYLHGQPGVGKSAIARELAARLAPQYPGGIHFVDLGTAGIGRPPGEVLKDLILAMGWDEADVPADPRMRAIAFRSLAARRSVLFVLDAARTADQVKAILPTDPRNGVIVTSRRDLTLDPEMQATRSFHVDVPTEAEALEIFRVMSRSDDRDRPECAAAIVEQCGRLPVAIQSAAERIATEDTDICAVSSYLAEPTTRLSRLEQPGRPVRAFLQTEFDRLLPEEQRALTALAFLPSPTVAPWVLMPLLDVRLGQAEALADRLVAAQMIELTVPPERTDLVRYTMPPLIRLFARQLAAQVPAAERAAALRRVDTTYQSMIAAVLNRLEPEAALPVPPVAGLELAPRIAEHVRNWIDTEYLTLVRQIGVAYENGHAELCWRLGALLGGATPPGVDYESTMEAYRQALKAAEVRPEPGPRAQTHLAKGRFLAAVGRHNEAEVEFELALDAVSERGAASGPDPALTDLLLGESLVRVGAHDLAGERLDECLRRATAAGDAERVYDAEILIAINSHVECPYWVRDRLQDNTLDEFGRFYARLAFADSARRAREWATALRELDAARTMARSDLSRTAFVAVRTAELHLHHALQLPQRSTEIDLAIQWACSAIWRYRQLRHVTGEQRAKCVLARAFGAAGLLGVAEQLAHGLKIDVESLPTDAASLDRALVARVHQVSGELLYRFGDASAARTVLIQAATLFQSLADPLSESDVRETIQRPPTARGVKL
jgi:tetratricopeptide (TPR) repeat protein